MTSTSKDVTLKSSDGEVSEVKEPAGVQSETIERDCVDDGNPLPISKKITLKSSDGEIFEVEESVAVESVTIKNMIEDDCTSSGIPIPNVTGKYLSMVLEYCKVHAGDKEHYTGAKIAEVKAWDKELAKTLESDQTTLYHLILASNFLDVKGLLDMTCQIVADKIKGKMPDEIRKTFNIENDFTPEDEEEIISEHRWAFQKGD